MDRRPTRGCADHTVGGHSHESNFFELCAAVAAPAQNSAFQLATTTRKGEASMAIGAHTKANDSPGGWKSKRIFEVGNRTSHGHITTHRSQPELDALHATGAANRGHRAAPFATAHSEGVGGYEIALFSTGRSTTPTRLRATSPSRSHGYHQRNSSSADSPFAAVGPAAETLAVIGGGTQAGASPRSRSPLAGGIQRNRSSTPPRHPILGDGMSPERISQRNQHEDRRSTTSHGVAHNVASPVATRLHSSDSHGGPVASKGRVQGVVSYHGSDGRDRVLGDEYTDPGTLVALEKVRAKVARSTGHASTGMSFHPHRHDAPPEEKTSGKRVGGGKAGHRNSSSIGGFRFGDEDAAHLRTDEERALDLMAGEHPRLVKALGGGGLGMNTHKLLAAESALDLKLDHERAHERAPFATGGLSGSTITREAPTNSLEAVTEAAPYHEVLTRMQPERELEPEPEAVVVRGGSDGGDDSRRGSMAGSGGGQAVGGTYGSWGRQAALELAPSSRSGGGGGGEGDNLGRRWSGSSGSSALEGRVTRRRGSEVVVRM